MQLKSSPGRYIVHGHLLPNLLLHLYILPLSPPPFFLSPPFFSLSPPFPLSLSLPPSSLLLSLPPLSFSPSHSPSPPSFLLFSFSPSLLPSFFLLSLPSSLPLSLPSSLPPSLPPSHSTPVACGSIVRFHHLNTRLFLHSHLFRSPLSGNQEVSCFGDGNVGDEGEGGEM